MGVGKVSDPALRMNDSCPAGMLSMILFQIRVDSSSSMISVNLDWTSRELSLASRSSLSLVAVSLRAFRFI